VSLCPFNFGFLSLQLKDVKFASLVLVLRLVVGMLVLRFVLGLPGLLIRWPAMDDFAVGGIVGGIRPMFFAVKFFPVLARPEVFRLRRLLLLF
jgi:hypothetical protein